MITSILENREYVLNIVPNDKDTNLPGRVLRVSNPFKRGANKDKKSKYFLCELSDFADIKNGYETVDTSERGRIVFTCMELTDKKRFNFLTRKLQESFPNEELKDMQSNSPLLDIKARSVGAYYKVYAPHTENGTEYANVSFFMVSTENKDLKTINAQFQRIKDDMRDNRGIKFIDVDVTSTNPGESSDLPASGNDDTKGSTETEDPFA